MSWPKNRPHPWNVGKLKQGLEPSLHPTTIDIVWAAGLFEGEGSVCKTGATKKYPGKFTTQVKIYQKDRWVLDKCRELFGGSVLTRTQKGSKLCPQSGEISSWQISGPRGRGFIMTIYKFLSPRRKEQAKIALGIVNN